MPARPLRIAWLGPGPSEDGGVGGVLTDLLAGLSSRGLRIDCFLAGRERPLAERITGDPNLTFVWGASAWKWDRWYSRTRVGAFASGLLSRAFAARRVRVEVLRRHRHDPYDVIYQFSTIESLAVPGRLVRTVPLVIHPETHIAGELRFMIAERRLALRGQGRLAFATVVAIMAVRALVQRVRIHRADLLIAISAAFRDHLVRDYGFPAEHTVVVPNPVRVERFAIAERGSDRPPTVLVLGRIAVRKGVEDVVAVARMLLERGSDVRVRIVGGASLFSDYTPLLDDLPANAEYVGPVPASEVPGELARCDLLLQASKYEPFAITVAEALASGVPVVTTSEVGAAEGVDPSVAAVVAPGDVAGMADAITKLLADLTQNPAPLRDRARAEAERLFAPDVVCAQIADALSRLSPEHAGAAGGARSALHQSAPT